MSVDPYAVTFDVEPPTPVEALRTWFELNKSTPEVVLAIKHRGLMSPAVVAELKARAPGDTDEERELGLVFGLAQISSQLDTVQLLLGNLRVEHLPGVEPPATVRVSHVDVTPLDPANVAVVDTALGEMAAKK